VWAALIWLRHAVVREHLESFLARAPTLQGGGYPQFIDHEFRR